MAEKSLTVDPTNDARKQKLGQILESKLEQGYRIESRGDTEAVLFTQGHRSWFGLFGSGEGARLMVSVDEQGSAKTQKLPTGGASVAGSGDEPQGG
jgi:hypothetical protein